MNLLGMLRNIVNLRKDIHGISTPVTSCTDESVLDQPHGDESMNWSRKLSLCTGESIKSFIKGIGKGLPNKVLFTIWRMESQLIIEVVAKYYDAEQHFISKDLNDGDHAKFVAFFDDAEKSYQRFFNRELNPAIILQVLHMVEENASAIVGVPVYCQLKTGAQGDG